MTGCAAPRDAKQAPGGCGPAPVWFPYRAFEGGIVSFPQAAPPARNAETDQKKTPSAGRKVRKTAPPLPAARPKQEAISGSGRNLTVPSVSDLPSPRRDHSDRLAGHLTPFRTAGGPAERQRMMYFSCCIISAPPENVKRKFSFFADGAGRGRCAPPPFPLYSPGSMRMTLPMFQV